MIVENKNANLRREKTFICFLELQVVHGTVSLPKIQIAKAKNFCSILKGVRRPVYSNILRQLNFEPPDYVIISMLPW